MNYAVIRLGSFGYNLAKLSSRRGLYVTTVSQGMDKVEKIKDKVAESVCFEATEADLLQKPGVNNVNVVIISVSDENFQAAEYIVLELQDRGVNKIYVIPGSEREEQIIKRLELLILIIQKFTQLKI